MARYYRKEYDSAAKVDKPDESILEHISVVKQIAFHLKGRVPDVMDINDMIQVGTIGLMEAAKVFREEDGIGLEVFAKSRIRGAILDEVRKLSRLPRSAIVSIKTHNKATKELSDSLGREPRNNEVAEHLGISLEQYEKEREHANRFATVSDPEGTLIQNQVDTRSHAEDPGEAIANDETKRILAAEIEELSEREQLVLSLYYEKELNLKEIGAAIGVSESRVSQILSTTAKKLRTKMMNRI